MSYPCNKDNYPSKSTSSMRIDYFWNHYGIETNLEKEMEYSKLNMKYSYYRIKLPDTIFSLENYFL